MVDLEELAASLSSVGNIIYRKELRESLHKMIAAMSPVEREILTLVHFESLTVLQASQESESTWKRQEAILSIAETPACPARGKAGNVPLLKHQHR